MAAVGLPPTDTSAAEGETLADGCALDMGFRAAGHPQALLRDMRADPMSASLPTAAARACKDEKDQV